MTPDQPVPSIVDRSDSDGTTACCLTGTGRSAIAVVSLVGPLSDKLIAKHFSARTDSPWRVGQIRYGDWTRDDERGEVETDAISESVVLTPIADQEFEIHCHGGRAAVQSILEDLAQSGATVIEPGDHRRWRTSRLQHEAELTLMACTTRRLAAYPLTQIRGGLQTWAEDWLHALSEPFSPNTAVTPNVDGLHQQARRILRLAEFTTRITTPFHVVFCGAANVGKSSLINAIVGYQRSITFDQPGTTRDVIEATTVLEGLPIRLSDTAGIRELDETDEAAAIERAGMAKAREVLQEADLVIHVVDVQTGHDRLQQWARNMSSVGATGLSVLHLVNKIDLLDPARGTQQDDPTLLKVSATVGTGVESLCQSIVAKLVPEFPDDGEPIVLNHRQRDAIRNLLLTSDAGEIRCILLDLTT